MKNATITTAHDVDSTGHIVTGVIAAPGLLVANNPSYEPERMTCQSKFAILHMPSGLTAGTTASKKRALEVCKALSAMLNWDVSKDELFKATRVMRIASRLMRRLDEKRSVADLIAEIATSMDEGDRVASAVEENRKARNRAAARKFNLARAFYKSAAASCWRFTGTFYRRFSRRFLGNFFGKTWGKLPAIFPAELQPNFLLAFSVASSI